MKKYIFTYILIKTILVLSGMIITTALQAQNGKTPLQQFEFTVTDEESNPLSGVQIAVADGFFNLVTDEFGVAKLKADAGDFLTIKLAGYEIKFISLAKILENNLIVLKKSKLFISSEDNVPLPFNSIKKRNISSSAKVLSGSQLESYPTSDIRNSFSGLVTGLEVVERNGAPGLTAEETLGSYGITQKVSLYSRGGSPIFIIDDLQVDITEMPLDPHEIETVTVVKDIVGKAMYGPDAANGIVYIKTKHGRKNERLLDVNTESGISMTDRFPEWVSGSDYARLNNQARQNSGMLPMYSDDDISEYAKNDPYNLYHPNINFRNLMFKDNRSYSRMNVSAGGGNEKVQYYAYLGYTGEGDNYNMGSSSDYNRINARSNIDIKITEDLKVKLGIYGGLTLRNSPNYGYFTAESNTSFALIEMNSVLDDITSTPPIAFPIYAAYNEEENIPWYGVSSSYGSNPIGNLNANGYYTESTRTSAANIALDYDLSKFIPGLKSRTFGTFNILNLIRIGKSENYVAYTATPSSTTDGRDTILLTKVHDGVDMADQIKLHDYYYQRLSFYETLSYDKSIGNHDLQLGLTYLLSNGMKEAVREPVRQQNAVLSALYSFSDKYSIQGIMNYAGTSSFAKSERYGLFPSLGVSWIISEENFMKKLQFIDYLKLRAETGVLGYDGLSSTFYYNDNWGTNTSGATFGPYTTNQWFGSDTDNSVYRSYPNRISNPDLTWEKRKEVSIGIDALLFKQKLSLELSYYNNTRDGIISKLENVVPYFTGIYAASPWQNYDKIKYYGLETGLQFTDKIGKVGYSFGGNATIQNSKILKYDEPNYRESYLSRIGKPADAWFGQTYLGRYVSDAEAQSVIQNYDELLYAGDLKYKDLNSDGSIDDNDKSQVGHTSPRLIYAINLKLSYMNFDLTAVGTGRAFYDIPLTNRYFWNGWGDNTYSKFVQDNIGGAYPRLTYQKVNNNFTASDFWLVKGGFFKIQNVELAYNLILKNKKAIGAKSIKFYTRGSNLLTFSKVKDVDPESVSSGISVYPLSRAFTCGIKLTF